MNIALVDVPSDGGNLIYKDWAGGYGTAFSVGNSLRARFLQRAKKTGIKLPLTRFGYLAAIFRQSGHEVGFYQEDLPDSADVVLLHSSIVDVYHELAQADRLRKQLHAKVGFVGPFSGAMPDMYLEHADFVVKGEPEDFGYRIADLGELSGVIESRPIDDLDELPFPDWSIFPRKRYSYYPNIKARPFLPILSSRGCPYKCSYCAYRAAYKWRARSVENTVDEIERNVNEYGTRGLLFRDPLFTWAKDRPRQIAEEILRRHIDVRWGCETHLGHLDRELLDLLYKAGLRSVNVGIEVVNPKTLAGTGRESLRKDRQLALVKHCDKLGIRVTAFYLFGLPNSTAEDMRETARYARKLNTHVASFNVLTPYPGTEFYDSVKDEVFEKDFTKFTSYTPVMHHKHVSKAALEKLREEAFVRFYFRPAYIIKFLQRMFLWR
ncbi:MAG TPA: radical SAM protein [bacterium]|nr:radical SAM protein [bacterium]